MRINCFLSLTFFISLHVCAAGKHAKRFNEFVATFNTAAILNEKNIDKLSFGNNWDCWTIGPGNCDGGTYQGPKKRFRFLKPSGSVMLRAKEEKSLLPLPVAREEQSAGGQLGFAIINQVHRYYEEKRFFISQNGGFSEKGKTELRITKDGYLITKNKNFSGTACPRYNLCKARELDEDLMEF